MDALRRRRPPLHAAESSPAYGAAFVVDASTAFKWVVPEEPGLAAALAIRRRLEHGELVIHAPDLILLEIGNAIRFSRRHPALDHRALLRDFAGLSVRLVRPDEFLVEQALDLALKDGLTVYDALYCALADRLEIPLITADEKLVRKLPQWGRFQPLRTFLPSGEA